MKYDTRMIHRASASLSNEELIELIREAQREQRTRDCLRSLLIDHGHEAFSAEIMNWTPVDTLLDEMELLETQEELSIREEIERDNEA